MKEGLRKDKTLLKVSWVSTIGNSILSAAKITLGIIAGSMAVTGDGIDSATDVVISIVMIITARIMQRPPNRKYAYGYEKAEGIATKVLSLVILYAGIQMLITTGGSLWSSETRELPSMIAIYVTVFSILGKISLAVYQFRQGKKVNSSMLMANAKNMRNDVIISVSVLLGLFFTFILRMPILDSITGLLISVYIIRSAILIFIDANIELMDGVKDVSVYEKIFKAVEAVPGALNPHRVRSRQIGNMYMIALDIEADGGITLCEAHKIAEKVEQSIKSSVENVYDIIVHVEPLGNEQANERYGLDKSSL
ncbi:MAG: cation diffusion facilitator family transporter [Culturomica sp.]|jgi:cation diffusion facilitator family transporter|nr:cation diffusion facilitator family transporter [Culturomica sp.]